MTDSALKTRMNNYIESMEEIQDKLITALERYDNQKTFFSDMSKFLNISGDDVAFNGLDNAYKELFTRLRKKLNEPHDQYLAVVDSAIKGSLGEKSGNAEN